jgi:hypothetical protein
MTWSMFLSIYAHISDFPEVTNTKDGFDRTGFSYQPGALSLHIDMPRSCSGLIYVHPHRDIPTPSRVTMLRMQLMKSVGGLPHD